MSQVNEEGWEILFNGKDLTGWRELNGKHKWEVRDGIIIGTDVHNQPNGFLCTEKDYGDFILELEVSIDTLMNNSGIQFRSLSTPDYLNGRVHGYQMELDPKPQRWSGSIYDEGGRRGWLYTTELNEPGKKAFKNNQWNTFRIECFGTTNRTWVNGIPIAHLVDAASTKGFIGLQLHANSPTDPPGGNQVRFRNIRIKTKNIKPSPPDDIFVVNMIPNDLSLQERKAGYVLLWDGRSEKGWRTPYTPSFPKSGWQVRNNELAFLRSEDNSSARELMTTSPYSSFILKFDFKISKGANSGVKYFVAPDKKKKAASPGNTIVAPEYQIIDDSIQGVTATRTLGSLTELIAARKTGGGTKRIGEWNQGLIKVLPDNKVEYWLNGYKILEYNRRSSDYLTRLSNSIYAGLPVFATATKGYILLEGQSGEVSFRSIKIKPL